MSDIATLIERVRRSAERETFPIDIPIYRSAGKDPLQPVLYAGNLSSQLCFFGRDLGRDEVLAGQPLIGAAGTLVRSSFFLAWQGREPAGRQDLLSVCDRVLLTNTVPYKPPGNKAYSSEVKERFRPYIEQLLVLHWRGDHVITLGTEAFKWFAPYGKKGEVNRFFQREDRYNGKLRVVLTATDDAGRALEKPAFLLPLPHPSPLNQQYYPLFPGMLRERLNDFAF
jgi:uracil-DNA glycosylase